MKRIQFIYFLLLSYITFAQNNNDIVVYLDSLRNVSTESNYKYVCIIKDTYQSKKTYSFKEYYKSGNVSFVGTTNFNYPEFFLFPLPLDGINISYYENGNKKLYSNYVYNVFNGKQYGWYENGKIKFEKEFKYDIKAKKNIERIINFVDEYDVKKVIDGNGEYEEKEGLFIVSGEIKNGFKEGDWNGKHSTLNTRFVETYKKGELISGVSFDENNVSHKYTEIQTKAEPAGGMTAFSKNLTKNFYLSRDTKIKHLKGKIFIDFVVTKNGEIGEAKVIRDLGFETGKEAIRALKHSKKWIPATYRGLPIDSNCTLPIQLEIKNENLEVGIFNNSN